MSELSQVELQNLRHLIGAHDTSYQFRTAESFLNSLNKTKAEGVDLSQFRAGVTVYHKKFGEGVINSVEQEGEDLKLDINFEKAGHKRLMAKFANLEIR